MENTESNFDATGIDFEDVTASTYFSGSTVLSGGLDGEAVREELEDNEYEEDDEVGGYRLYVPDGVSDPRRCWGVGGSVFATSAVGDMDAVETAELLVETTGGDGSRQVDDSEAFGAVVDAVGAPTIGTGGTFDEEEGDEPESGVFEHSVGRGPP
ncbi:hypothetical protein [Halosegnis marinus]|uniref:hypothetical protein n=1 Tax=Halosegnis marinus TaxID=3034023 RepID=UPI003613DA57